MTVRRLCIRLATALLLFGGALIAVVLPTSAALVQNRLLDMSTSEAGIGGVTYSLQFDLVNSYSLGSIVLEICDDGPLPGTPCTVPAGFDASGVVLASQSGETGFAVHPSSTANRIVLGRAAAMTAPGTVSYDLGNIINPSLGNHTFYGRIYTYASSDGTGPSIDDGGLALSTANRVALTAEVPPYLLLCVAQSITGFDCLTATGNFLDFGEFSKTSVKTVESQLVIATNAGFGVGVSVSGLTLTSGNNVIPSLAVPTASAPGTSQFGINLRANTIPGIGQDPSGAGSVNPTANYNIPNFFTFNNGDYIAASAGASDVRKLTVTHIANVSNAQPPGVYNTTLTYIALASF